METLCNALKNSGPTKDDLWGNYIWNTPSQYDWNSVKETLNPSTNRQTNIWNTKYKSGKGDPSKVRKSKSKVKIENCFIESVHDQIQSDPEQDYNCLIYYYHYFTTTTTTVNTTSPTVNSCMVTLLVVVFLLRFLILLLLLLQLLSNYLWQQSKTLCYKYSILYYVFLSANFLKSQPIPILRPFVRIVSSRWFKRMVTT